MTFSVCINRLDSTLYKQVRHVIIKALVEAFGEDFVCFSGAIVAKSPLSHKRPPFRKRKFGPKFDRWKELAIEGETLWEEARKKAEAEGRLPMLVYGGNI